MLSGLLYAKVTFLNMADFQEIGNNIWHHADKPVKNIMWGGKDFQNLD